MKKFLGLLIAIIILAGAGGGIYAYQRHHDNTDGAAGRSANSNNRNPALIASNDPVAVISDYVPKKYPSLEISSSQMGTLAYKVDGYAFTSLIQGERGKTTVYFSVKDPKASAGSKTPASFRQDVNTVLAAKGYKQIAAQADVSTLLGPNSTYTYFANDSDTVCMLNAATTTFAAGLTCLKKADMLASAQAAQPFSAALVSANETSEDKLGIGTPKIETNKENPQYEHALVSFSAPASASQQATVKTKLPNIQAGAFFYRQTGSQEWTFYKSSQEGISCTANDNPIASTAFSDICSKQGY